MQRVLISFFNDDQDEMFAYFDTRMTSRLDQLKNNTAGNSQKLETIVDSTKKLYDYISLQQVINRLYQTMGMQNISQTSPKIANGNGDGHQQTPNFVNQELLGPLVEAEQQALQIFKRQPSRHFKEGGNMRQQTTMNSYMRQATIGSVTSKMNSEQPQLKPILLNKQVSSVNQGIRVDPVNKVGELLQNLYQQQQHLLGSLKSPPVQDADNQDTVKQPQQSLFKRKPTLSKQVDDDQLSSSSASLVLDANACKMKRGDTTKSSGRPPMIDLSTDNNFKELDAALKESKRQSILTNVQSPKEQSILGVQEFDFDRVLNQEQQKTMQRMQDYKKKKEMMKEEEPIAPQKTSNIAHSMHTQIIVEEFKEQTPTVAGQRTFGSSEQARNTFIHQNTSSKYLEPVPRHINTMMMIGGPELQKIELPQTAEQLLEHLRAHRRDNEDSNYSQGQDGTYSVYDRSLSDLPGFNSLFTQKLLQQKASMRGNESQIVSNSSDINANPKSLMQPMSNLSPNRVQKQIPSSNGMMTKERPGVSNQGKQQISEKKDDSKGKVKVVAEDSFRSDTMSDDNLDNQ